ncbi:vitamin B12-dependent ribonucleotide reductase, partial [Pseudoroseomonas wenyumeiae]
PQPARPLPPPRPATARGQVWRVTLAGHRVTLTTTEAPDGGLASIGLAMARDGAAFRGLMDSFVHVVNLGLARGMPLSDYVQAVAYGQGGPCGTVEGDPEIRRATSVLDWAFRRLACAYLDGAEARHLWPDPSEEDCATGTAPVRADAPQLPLALPAKPSPAARRSRLRLVG